ncbi:ATP-binding cassette domain-containing protein [Halalkalibacterium halodurans]|uniref:Teichoic acid ABC transporter (ATP-binding protein) n=1 Tax=Halalkalibacterium halodurans (strain ATCC BAA-125 / DSM 18197 / FERM 7344 / JCM 9153 / C-125) TaxID=272558 RepID=Q9K6R8_HALH5|nr:ATP-binding cassette domain-containing protein [Halalkalibacterium halodurans]MED4081973.1 ATP-binding cassette domain-containing protein [Halalkalibacterium halodurans]MED4083645.1 ATP-binding cassette domain-containing protein [Halalkalibacterium halodurans]MED4106601.1 ATP-binding cassette domain-containing protein [Halalkalibacterium halodurans]MED4107863.1 ATP-binding cassette domain-containing protein [Halalkalibacterium halodurans]MED4123021.1 ATP-binding cassette domain-containing p
MTLSMTNQDKQIKEANEVVIQATNLGVSFHSGYRTDDYKSHIFNWFSRKSKTNEGQEESKIVWPLRNLDFTGYKGEILGIIGSNGAGKTTLCKMLSGILKPDEGELYVDGRVSALFSLGMGFKKELTGRENAYLNGMMLGIEKDQIDQFIDEIHEFSGLGSFIDQPMKYYSSGMKARLGFSVAAFLEPEILILDEALNTGDAAFGKKAAAKMKELVSKAKMVILVTHSLRYARKNCDRLLWLDRGEIRAIGEPAEVIEKYKETIPVKVRRPRKRLELKKTEANVKERTVVKAENIGMSFNFKNETFWALKNVSFDIKEGEVVGIIGHNGAGKSTLCKLLTKILTPDEGELELSGETTSLLSYGTGFNAQLSGKDNVYLNGMLLGIPKERVAQEYPNIVAFSELEKHMDKPVKSYSSGMKSRLGFSIAATLQPDIFIIDEALSTGDVAFQQKASEKIQEMMERAKAVIIVSHSMKFVESVCTRAIWLEKGQVRFDGDPEEAVKLYKGPETEEKKKTKRRVVRTKKKAATEDSIND